MAGVKAVALLLFALFAVTLAQNTYWGEVVDISAGDYTEDEIYRIPPTVGAQNVKILRTFIVNFRFSANANTDAIKGTIVRSYQNLEVPLAADAIYNEITGQVTTTQQANSYRITDAAKGQGDRWFFNVELVVNNAANARQSDFPARMSFPVRATDSVTCGTDTCERRWSNDFFSGVRRSPAILFEKNDINNTPVTIWRGKGNGVVTMDTARFVEPALSLESNDWIGLKSATLITNGGSGPNEETNFFKVAFSTNRLLKPGQQLLCNYVDAANNRVSRECAKIFGFFNLFQANGNVINGDVAVNEAFTTYNPTTGVANGAQTTDVANFLAQITTNWNNNFQRMLVTTGTTVLPGDTIFVEFRLSVPIVINGVFGIGATATQNPYLRLSTSSTDPNALNNVITRYTNYGNAGNDYFHTPGQYLAYTHLAILPELGANQIDRYEPHTLAVNIRTNLARIYGGQNTARARAGFQIENPTQVKTSPISVITFLVGTDAAQGPNFILTGLTPADFSVQLSETGALGSAPYEGTITISSESGKLTPFISGQVAYLNFDPPLEVRDGTVTLDLLSGKTATDAAGVISGVPGNKVVAFRAANQLATLRMRVQCPSTYGLIRCGAACRHFVSDDNCGGCGTRCAPETTGKFCMLNPSVTDTVNNRHLSSRYSCNSPALYSAVPIPINVLAQPPVPSIEAGKFVCPATGSAAGWCFYWRNVKAIFDALPALRQGEVTDVRYFTKFRFLNRENPPADPNFSVQLHIDMRNVASRSSLPLVPNNPLFLASVQRISSLTDNDPGRAYEWYSVGKPPGDVVVVAMKFSSAAAAQDVGPRINTDDFLKVQARNVPLNRVPSIPVGGFTENNPQRWENADFSPPSILNYDENRPFDPRTNPGLTFRATPGGVVIRYATAGDRQTPRYRAFIEVRKADDAFDPKTVSELLNVIIPTITNDWENIQQATECCSNRYSGAFDFVAGNVARIDIAGLDPNTQYKAWMVLQDSNNEPNNSPIIRRTFTTGAVLTGATARSSVNLDFSRTVRVTV